MLTLINWHAYLLILVKQPAIRYKGEFTMCNAFNFLFCFWSCNLTHLANCATKYPNLHFISGWTNFTNRSTIANNSLNHALVHVKYAAEYLDEATLQSEDIIQKINTYSWSLDDEFSDIEDLWPFTYDSPPHTPNMRSCLDDEMIFDSDGRYSKDSDDL